MLESRAVEQNTSFCKWNFPWPKQVKYYVYNSQQNNLSPTQFSQSDATRIGYGGDSWNGAHVNLSFQKVSSQAQSTNGQTYHIRGVLNQPASVLAQAYVRYAPNGSLFTPLAGVYPVRTDQCNLDAGRPITQVGIVWNWLAGFHWDCLATGNYCVQNGLSDFHNTSAHEMGHMFYLAHAPATGSTMYSPLLPGDTQRRSLATQDIIAAREMYGCAPGYTWMNLRCQ